MAEAIRMAEIRAALGGRGLVWFGTRGIDALGLFPLARPLLVSGQVAPIGEDMLDGVQQDNLELRSRLRRDLDQYDIDRDLGIDAIGLKTEFLARITGPVVLVAYRTAELLSRPSFCHSSLVMAAPFHLMQRQFEYKPWVEIQLLQLEGVSVLRSKFVRDDDVEAVVAMLDGGPMVGRCSTGAGGAGVFPFSTEEEYVERLPSHADGFVGITPFLDHAVPLNINACVYTSGDTAVFGVSYQLIGVRGLTRRAFGFCGNDFAAASDLDPAIFEKIETCARAIGSWLARYGYKGLFGLDLMWHGGKLYVSEINPRFQASTPLSARINQAAGLPDPMTEHVAAYLDMAAPAMPSLIEQAHACAAQIGSAAVVQVIHRNISTSRLRIVANRDGSLPDGVTAAGLPEPGIYVDREAMLFKSMHCRRVTRDGYSVSDEVHATKKTISAVAY